MASPIRYVYDDGGRAAAGFPSLLLARSAGHLQGRAGDCQCRAITIATGLPYAEVRTGLAELIAQDGNDPSMVDTGAVLGVGARYLQSLGWGWTINAPQRGPHGRVRHRTMVELGPGRYVVEFRSQTYGHSAALVDGELRDLTDMTRSPMWGWWSTDAPVVPLV